MPLEAGSGDIALEPTLPAPPNGLAGTKTVDPAVEAMRRRLTERLFGIEQESIYLGRFRIHHALGSGGMGVIFAAYDDKLARLVALKVITAARRAERGPDKERLLAEARALARLSHPNVVHVYEVGETSDDVFIVMEHISGITLQKWLAAATRPLAAILAMFVAAGRGLAAAHAAGIVHRDFKPSNVMVGNDGRVCLIDFGLAQGPHALDTDAGRVAGTPAYMPPEIFGEHELDARADQFSFCVALYEAVHGRLPFPSGAVAALAAGALPAMMPPVGRSVVPRWLRRLLTRGLAFDAEQRFPTLGALLDELERAPRRRQRRTVGGIAFLASIAALAAAAKFGTPMDRCSDDTDPLADIWGDERRAQLAAVVGGAPLADPERTWTTIADNLDEYAARWRDARRNSCEATWRRGEQSAQLLDRSMLCLERARRALAALLGLLGGSEATHLVTAQDMVAALPDPRACRDIESLLASEDPPASDPRTVALEETFQRARLLYSARRGHEILPELDQAIDAAAAMGRPDLESSGLLLRGKVVRLELDDDAAAIRDLQRAHARAIAAGSDANLWAIWAELALAAINVPGHAPEAVTFLEYAWSAFAHLPSPDPLAKAQLVRVEADLALHSARHAEAIELYRRALALRRERLPDDHPDVMSARRLLARSIGEGGERDEAARLLRALIAEQSRIFGQDHPLTVEFEIELADLLRELGDGEGAHRLLSRVRPLLVAAHGADGMPVADVDLRLAAIAADAGRVDEAIRAAEAARATLSRRVAADDHDHLMTLLLLAQLYAVTDRPAAILAVNSELLAIQDARPELDLDLAGLLTNIGNSLCRLGRCAEALPAFSRLLAEFDRRPPEAPARRAFPLQGLGRVHLAKGEPAFAVPLLTQAYDLLREDPRAEPQITISTARLLAQALTELGVQPGRVRKLRREADALERASAPSQNSHDGSPPR